MKIALVHKRLDLGGGTERDLYKTVEGLRDLGHDVHLFCAEYGIAPPAGVSAHRVQVLPLGRTVRLWSFAFAVPKLLRRYPCDVVVNFGRMLSQDVIRSGGGSHRVFLQKLGEAGGVRRRLWQKISIYHRSLLALEKRQFQAGHYKKILAVSETVKEELRIAYGVQQGSIVVIYNGVDHERFHPSLRDQFRRSVRTEWRIPLDTPTVLFVGSGFRRKGLDRLLRVWQSPRMRDICLLIVGDDAQLDKYKAAVQGQGINVVFAGRQQEVHKYYGAADVVALPAVQEAFGNVVLEGLASGLPVVVSRAVGAAEVLRGSLAEGIVADPEDPDEIETKLLTMLKRSSGSDIRNEARELAEEYSWQNHFLKLQGFLEELVQKDRRGCSS